MSEAFGVFDMLKRNRNNIPDSLRTKSVKVKDGKICNATPDQHS